MYDVYENKPLSLVLLKTSSYVKIYNDGTKWMCYLIEDDELLKKYNDILNKVSNSMKKEFDIEPIYNEKISGNQNKIL